MRVIHTGDTHLGYRQYNSEERRRDFTRAFERVVSDAITLGVDAVVHAGDLFDSRTPSLEDIVECARILRRLHDAGIPFLGIVGNHESKHGRQWLDLFQDLDLARRLRPEPHILDNVAFYGVDSVPRSRIPNFDYSQFEPAEDAKYHVLVMHQLLKPFPHGVWDTEEILEEVPMGVDALLLGDNHKREIEQIEGTWTTYCGSTERTSDSDREPRSYNLLSFSDGVQVERRLIETREFTYLDSVDVTGGDEIVFERLRERDLEDRVVVVEVTGDPTIQVSQKEVEEFILDRGALVARVKDRRGAKEETRETRGLRHLDPDRAVHRRLEEMGLSETTRMLDEIIRGDTPKSRVLNEVENRIQGQLESLSEGQLREQLEKPKQPPESQEKPYEAPVGQSEGQVGDGTEERVEESEQSVESLGDSDESVDNGVQVDRSGGQKNILDFG